MYNWKDACQDVAWHSTNADSVLHMELSKDLQAIEKVFFASDKITLIEEPFD